MAAHHGQTSTESPTQDLPVDPRLAQGLRGRVAQILNERELVINVGEQEGVEEGMRFAVLAGSPVQIPDPETGEPLGWLDREKVRVEAINVMERMSVCETYDTRLAGGALGLLDVGGMFRARQHVPVTLRATRESYPEPLSAAESYVKIGDVVRELKELDDIP
jgi:hypothetical protein